MGLSVYLPHLGVTVDVPSINVIHAVVYGTTIVERDAAIKEMCREIMSMRDRLYVLETRNTV